MNEPHEPVQLSPEGEARRDAMLPGLQTRVVRTARARRTRSRVVAGAALFAIASLGVLILPVRPPSKVATDDPRPPVESTRGVIEVVRTDPGVLERLAATPESHGSVVERIGDDELMFALAAIGRPTGIVRTQGRVWLTAAVTDQELEPDRGSTGPI